MPTVTLLNEGAPTLLPMRNRSPGLHVSDIIHDLCLRLGHLEPRDDPFQPEWGLLGNALEFSIIQMMQLEEPDRYVQPGEIEKDGIFGTPDLLDCARPPVIHEMKLAWMSAKWGPGDAKFWRYETQIRCYCHMMEIGTAHLHVYHVNGEYKEAGPIYRKWQYEFSRQELAENWRMITRAGERLMREADKKSRKRV